MRPRENMTRTGWLAFMICTWRLCGLILRRVYTPTKLATRYPILLLSITSKVILVYLFCLSDRFAIQYVSSIAACDKMCRSVHFTQRWVEIPFVVWSHYMWSWSKSLPVNMLWHFVACLGHVYTLYWCHHCFTSCPSGNQVDGLPLVANLWLKLATRTHCAAAFI